MFQKVWSETAEFITSTEKQYVVQCRKSEIYPEIIVTIEHYFYLRMEIWVNIDIFYFVGTATYSPPPPPPPQKKSTAVNIKKNYFIKTSGHLCANSVCTTQHTSHRR
jgi:hypothetical protein